MKRMQIIELREAPGPDAKASGSTPSDTWVDIDMADADARRWLIEDSGLDEEVVEHLLKPPSITFWRRFGTGRHLQMRAAVPGNDPSEIAVSEFGIWLEPGRVISLRHGNAPAFDRVRQACLAGKGPENSWQLILFVLAFGMDRVADYLHDLLATIDELEDETLAIDKDSPIHRIGELQKRLVYARRFGMPLANMLSFLSNQRDSLFDSEFHDDFDAMATAVHQYQELLALSIERASALQGQIRDQMADSMNQATYRFTWVATVFLPLSFLTGLLGINVAGIPGDHNPEAFWLVCVALIVVSVLWAAAVSLLNRPFRRRRNRRDD
jgi:zinc transporter